MNADEELESLIAEASEQEREARAALVAQGVSEETLDAMEADLLSPMDRPPTLEEEELFNRVYERVRRNCSPREAEFLARHAREHTEWREIAQELTRVGGDPSAHDVTTEQRRRMAERGETPMDYAAELDAIDEEWRRQKS